MSIAKRPFKDGRNTYLVRNDDPGAFDKSYVGQPGTHKEQRCCGDKAPYWDSASEMVAASGFLYGRPLSDVSIENRAFYRNGNTEELWCKECSTALESAWGQFVDALAFTAQEGSGVLRGIAIACSYVPIFGTAVSFVLTSSLSLAEGESVDEALLDGIGGALPGQPASQVVFNGVRSVIAGDRIDVIAIQSLPIDQSTKSVISSAVRIVERIANGEDISKQILDEIYSQLPDTGKRAMSIAQEIIDGKNVGSVAMREAGTYAKAQGDEAIKQYVAEAGYQGALESLTPEIRDALTAGVIAGEIERLRFRPAPMFMQDERNILTNDKYVEKAFFLYDSGAYWKSPQGTNILLSTIRNGSHWTSTINFWNALTNSYEARIVQDEVTENWRRGFDIAIGACQGLSADGLDQQKIRITLFGGPAHNGFDAGQAIQFDRTNQLKRAILGTVKEVVTLVGSYEVIGPDGKTASQRKAEEAATNANYEYAKKGSAIALRDPRVAAGRAMLTNDAERYGFDVATGLCAGYSIVTTAMDNALASLTVSGRTGFLIGQALQLGITKQSYTVSTQPSIAVGQLVISGIVGSGLSGDQKAATVAGIATNPLARSGAVSAIEEHKSVWDKILEFLGIN